MTFRRGGSERLRGGGAGAVQGMTSFELGGDSPTEHSPQLAVLFALVSEYLYLHLSVWWSCFSSYLVVSVVSPLLLTHVKPHQSISRLLHLNVSHWFAPFSGILRYS